MTELVRFTLEISREGQEKLKVLAKEVRLSQSEVLQCLIELAEPDSDLYREKFQIERERKLAFREKLKEVRAKMKKDLYDRSL